MVDSWLNGHQTSCIWTVSKLLLAKESWELLRNTMAEAKFCSSIVVVCVWAKGGIDLASVDDTAS